MSNQEILIRVVISVVMAGIIGYEREYKNRPAGMKTHILVCMGGTAFAILERLLVAEGLNFQLNYPDVTNNVYSISIGRLVAQVISGIGFLGAGTIMITRRSITGLTTAASIWIVACLGIIIGYGMYALAITVFVVIMITLVILKKIVRVNEGSKRLEIKYYHRVQTKEFINQYFNEKGIIVKDVDFNVQTTENGNIYTNIYTIDMPLSIAYIDILEDLSVYKNVIRIRTITIIEN